ncbi:hypothetical protein G6O69_01935 [Pseudenhygromyxa sp. WMMC2535]|uniref:hypothetical protein n=1 Tax=Pseudenhygromyxa sp. WMMC2535 TaxID=2712867 RepID=UPI001552D2D6|nr:hypothetical protein [Pseudenhygromyxa sp. WMMC2535]NVB36574.1 hypothetical protein [Pseudenhygromyxa sp. WMMC2535]
MTKDDDFDNNKSANNISCWDCEKHATQNTEEMFVDTIQRRRIVTLTGWPTDRHPPVKPPRGASMISRRKALVTSCMLAMAGSLPIVNVAHGESMCKTSGTLSHRTDRGTKFRFQGELPDFVQSIKTIIRDKLSDGRNIDATIDPNFSQVIVLRFSSKESHHEWGAISREVLTQITLMALNPDSDEGVPTIISTSWIRKDGQVYPACADEVYHLKTFHKEVTLLLHSLFSSSAPAKPKPPPEPLPADGRREPASTSHGIVLPEFGEQLTSRLVVADDAVTYETSVEALFMVADRKLYDDKAKVQKIVDTTMLELKDFTVKTPISQVKLKPINCMLNDHVLTIDLAASEKDGAAAQVVIDTRIEYSEDPLIKAHMRILATPATRVKTLNYMTSDDEKKRIALASMTKILDELGNRLTAKLERISDSE